MSDSPVPAKDGDLLNPVVLSAEHEVDSFSCGEDELDRFLKEVALNRQKAHLSRTYVCLSGLQVAGYTTLSHVQITSQEMPPKLSRGMPSSIPALLLARLAVDERFQGRGLGQWLLADALRRVAQVVRSGAAPVRFFVVDAKHDRAKAFYLKLGMKPLSDDSLRLYLSYKDVLAAMPEE